MIHLIDASVYVFRAWYALPATLVAPDSRPVNAVYGWCGFLLGLIEEVRPSHLAAAFDQSLTSSFRNALYPPYKANREPAPEELKVQFELCRRVSRALGVHDFASPHFEADDLIATLAAKARRARNPVVILTSDKDLAQLVGERDVWWDYAGRTKRDRAALRARYGVWPEQMVDYLALAGDPVDNIPGVRGVGPKAAIALLERFRDLDHVYASLAEIPKLPFRSPAALAEKLAASRELAFLSRQLATARADVPGLPELPALRWRGVDRAAFGALCDELGFGAELRGRAERVAALAA